MSKVIWTTCIHINEFGIANINIILLIRVTILCHLVTVGGRFGRGSCLKSSARLGLMSKVPLFLRCGGSFNRSSMPTEKSIEQASNKHFGRELDRTLSMIELKKKMNLTNCVTFMRLKINLCKITFKVPATSTISIIKSFSPIGCRGIN